MISPVDEIRALAARAQIDANAEERTAREAMVRGQAYVDKYHELMALAARIEAGSSDNPT